MASSDHKTKIEIKIDDTEAQASIDRLVSQLEKAQQLANMQLNLSGPTGAGAGPGVGGVPSTGKPPRDGEEEEDASKKKKSTGDSAFEKAVSSLESLASSLGTGGGTAHLQVFQPVVAGLRSVTNEMGKIGFGFGGIASTIMNTMIAGTEARINQFGQIAATEPGNAMTTYLGGSAGFRSGQSLGFGPQAASQILSNFFKTVGSREMSERLRTDKQFVNPFLAIRRGEDPSIAPRILSQAVAGGGVAQVSPSTGTTALKRGAASLGIIRGRFAREGFRGANIDKIMGGVSELVDTLQRGASNGLDMSRMATLALNPNFTGLGLRAFNPLQGVARMGTSAADEILSPFQSLAKDEMKAMAFSGGRGYAEAAQFLRDFGNDPIRSMNFLRGSGLETTMGMGVSLDEAKKIRDIPTAFRGNRDQLEGRLVQGLEDSRSAAGLGSLRFSKLFAERQATLMDEASRGGSPEALMDLMTELNVSVMAMSKSADTLAGMMSGAIKAIRELMSKVPWL